MKMHDLTVVMVNIPDIMQHPDNANNGDMDSIEESIAINGFYSPIIVQRSTGYILAGNHRYLGAIRQGAAKVPVIYLDVTDLEGKRIMLADNATTRRGIDDEASLHNLLVDLYETEIGLHGSGFDVAMMHRLEQELNEPLHYDPEPNADVEATIKSSASTALHMSVTPVVDADGYVYEFTVAREGMGPLTKSDFNALRRAMGLDPALPAEIRAYDVASWR